MNQGMSQNFTKPLVKKFDPQTTVLQQTVHNPVNGVVKGGEASGIEKLPDLRDPPEKTAYIVRQVILPALGDAKSTRFYKLVAAKVPESVIRDALSAIKVDGARKPARLFTYKMQQYALMQRKRGVIKGMGG
jgi:hypothetical protein